MSRAVKPNPPTLVHGIGVALALSLAGGALLFALAPLLVAGTALRLLVALLGAAYLIYLLAGSAQRTGRIATLGIWTAVAAALWITSPPLSLYVLIHVGMLWIARSLYYYSGLLPVLADLGLNLLALAFAGWALARSGSPFLALWCFFLVQALFVLIPERIRGLARRSTPDEVGADDAFQRAHRAAEAALRRLAATR
jgi:hypothetical protein